jgi:uncharacterized protein YoaH (UPF0181 family)
LIMADNVPLSLKQIKPYLTHAKQVEKVDPLMAYYCMCGRDVVLVADQQQQQQGLFLLSTLVSGRRFAVEYGVEIRQKAPDEDSKMVRTT